MIAGVKAGLLCSPFFPKIHTHAIFCVYLQKIYNTHKILRQAKIHTRSPQNLEKIYKLKFHAKFRPNFGVYFGNMAFFFEVISKNTENIRQLCFFGVKSTQNRHKIQANLLLYVKSAQNLHKKSLQNLHKIFVEISTKFDVKSPQKS